MYRIEKRTQLICEVFYESVNLRIGVNINEYRCCSIQNTTWDEYLGYCKNVYLLQNVRNHRVRIMREKRILKFMKRSVVLHRWLLWTIKIRKVFYSTLLSISKFMKLIRNTLTERRTKPTVPYFKNKYWIDNVIVIGLVIGGKKLILTFLRSSPKCSDYQIIIRQ